MYKDTLLMSNKLNSDLALNDKVRKVTQEIVKLLNGMPMVQALSILADIKTILINGPIVDIANPRFQEALKLYPF